MKSLNGIHWQPGRPFVAGCRCQGCQAGPQSNCTCGVYAAKSLADLRRTGYVDFGIVGEVCLWGTVVEHQAGWRAQFAYPKKFVVPLAMMPFGVSRLESWLTTLAAYGCDIFVSRKTGAVPLWRRECGYEAEGLDLLVQRSKGWYAHRAEQRQIRRGDRVAILGRGIAVVEQVDERQVHALLWNRSLLRIGRKEIVWDEGNMRWEANANAPFECLAGERLPPHRGQ